MGDETAIPIVANTIDSALNIIGDAVEFIRYVLEPHIHSVGTVSFLERSALQLERIMASAVESSHSICSFVFALVFVSYSMKRNAHGRQVYERKRKGEIVLESRSDV